MHKNKEGYPNPTAGRAMKAADRPPEDLVRAIRLMKFAADCLGYEVEERIVLRNKETGRIWK